MPSKSHHEKVLRAWASYACLLHYTSGRSPQHGSQGGGGALVRTQREVHMTAVAAFERLHTRALQVCRNSVVHSQPIHIGTSTRACAYVQLERCQGRCCYRLPAHCFNRPKHIFNFYLRARDTENTLGPGALSASRSGAPVTRSRDLGPSKDLTSLLRCTAAVDWPVRENTACVTMLHSRRRCRCPV